ncbi:MAG: hypothetical protein AB1782_20995 [Cyanobacteriota bacterium]
MTYILKNLINIFTYPIRNTIRFSRPIKTIINEDKINIFSNEEEIKEEQRLINYYQMESFKNNSSLIHYKENLYSLKLLEDNLKNVSFNWDIERLKILDIGSKNFSYAISLNNFFSLFHPSYKTNRIIYLDGIEIDPYRIMVDLHSRYDYAMYYIKDLQNTKYITSNLLDFKENQYDIITWFLPFIVKEPLLNWGLPLKYFEPENMLKHAYNLLKSQGIILVVNQSEIEFKIQLQIIKGLGLNYIEIEKPYSNYFSPFKHERYITVVKKG